MSKIYAMSDIHGFYDLFLENLEKADPIDDCNKLILCGDYIDYGPDSCQVLYKVKELMEDYPNQVIALKGNHETMFLDFILADDKDIWNVEWLDVNKDFVTLDSFISQECKNKIEEVKRDKGHYAYLFQLAKILKADIMSHHKELIVWLDELPLYYETDRQIFVHAGINEAAGELWPYETEEKVFVSKYPATFGSFDKDIIAGHIATSTLSSDKDFHGIFWDGESHYFIDASVEKSGIIPMLEYDCETEDYRALNTSIRKRDPR